MKHWEILVKDACGKEEILKTLLKNRGLTKETEIKEFLAPKDPSSLDFKNFGIGKPEISKAIARIKKAITDGENIIVYGDYDVDGVCGTAILWETLNHLGAKVFPYIPHRTKEGYGLSFLGIKNIKSQNPSTKLILTVDHGITAAKEIDYAQREGIDVIITDHHQKSKKAPQALATLWTDQISGTGVAWLLAKELAKNSKNPTDNYLDFVAIATIADLLPLKNYNRSLVKFGLLELNKTQRVGLLALIEEAGLSLGTIGVYEVSFILSPRLNATGRIEHALDSLRLLCTRDPQKAKILSQKLGMVNRERQRLTEEAFLHARGLVEESSKLIFISHSSYNEGVIGLVAGKLTEEFFRPAIVVAEGKTHSKASARSINNFNIIEVIRRSEELLIDCGGHPMAAGFTIETIRLDELKNRLLKTVEKEITPKQLKKILKIDCEVKLSDINWSLYEAVSKLEPFGHGNPEPVFLTRHVRIKDLRLVGADGKHLKLLLGEESLKSSPLNPPLFFSAVGFGLGEWGQKLKMGDQVDLVYTLLVDAWNGEERLQLKIKDLRLSQGGRTSLGKISS